MSCQCMAPVLTLPKLCSVALLSKEGQDIKLHALHNPGGSQLHLVQRTMRSDTTLAGLASELKKVINIGDLAEG